MLIPNTEIIAPPPFDINAGKGLEFVRVGNSGLRRGATSGVTNRWGGGGGGGPTDPTISSWAQEGNTYSAATNYSYICTLDGYDIAYYNPTNNELSTLRWDGTDFSVVGNVLSLAAHDTQNNVCQLTTSRVCIMDKTGSADNLTAYDWDGTDWTKKGNSFSLTFGNYPAGSRLADNSMVVARSQGIDVMARYDFDGTDFAKVGNDFSTGTLDYHMPIGMTATRCALHSTAGTDKIEALDYASSTWSQTGNDYNPGANSGMLQGCRMSDTRITTWVGLTIQTLDFDGTNFTTEGTTGAMPSSPSWPRTMAMLDSTHVACKYWGGSGELVVMVAS